MKNIIFEIVGSILIIREQTDELKLLDFSNEMLEKYPKIKTVVIQTSKVAGVERSREFQHFMGIKTFETVHKEYGNAFEVDISTTFFSPRLSYERQRIANLVKEGEIVLNFFSGVGPFSIAIATKCRKCIVHSIELNEEAYNSLVRNIEFNRCKNTVKAYLGDAFTIVPDLFLNKVDRILLPLPLEAERALPVAFNSLKDSKGIIHWQITEKIQEKEKFNKNIEQKIENILKENQIRSSFHLETSRLIRWLAPRIAHIGIDLVFS
ncbi:MAG: class I SAM-dependent methyltransferase [Candidatus Heimdallarchaeaceae archaeon]